MNKDLVSVLWTQVQSWAMGVRLDQWFAFQLLLLGIEQTFVRYAICRAGTCQKIRRVLSAHFF